MYQATFRKISNEIDQMEAQGYNESTIKAVLNSKFSESDIENVYKAVIEEAQKKDEENQKQKEIKTTAEIEQLVISISEHEKKKTKLFLLEPIAAICVFDIIFVLIITPILFVKSVNIDSYEFSLYLIQLNTLHTWFYIIYFITSLFLKIFISPLNKSSYSHLMPNTKKNFLAIYRSEMRGVVLKNFLIGCLVVVVLQFFISLFLPYYEGIPILSSSTISLLALVYMSRPIPFFLFSYVFLFENILFASFQIAAITFFIFLQPFDLKTFKPLKKTFLLISLVFFGLIVFVFPAFFLYMIIPIIYLAIRNGIKYSDRLIILRDLITFHSIKKSLLWVFCFILPIVLFFTWQSIARHKLVAHELKEVENEPVILGELTVNTYPNGAFVYLNDEYQGVSKVSIPDIKDTYNIVKVIKDGYEETTRTVSFEEGKYDDKTIYITLKKNEPEYTSSSIDEKDADEKAKLVSLFAKTNTGEEKSRFNTDDGGLYFYFKFANWTGQHSLKFVFIEPGGGYFSDVTYELEADDFGILERSVGFDFGTKGKDLWNEMLKKTGEWQIILYLDNKYIESLPFYVDKEIFEEPEVVLVKKGTFEMGDRTGDLPDSSRPIHRVTLSYDYYIGKHEITFEQYDYFCEDTGREKPSDENYGRKTIPVINIDWLDAVNYCNWLSQKNDLPNAYDKQGRLLDENGEITTDISKVIGYRLPTEAEWEYAAKGGHLMKDDYLYSGSHSIDGVGWYIENTFSYPKARNIGQKQANQLDLYDMSGNVWEMCQDFWDEEFYQISPEENPLNINESKTRVVRGGSWISPKLHCRVTSRNEFNIKNYSTGFRIARTK